ncbi:MAG TPA: V-type ATP synthase subunit A, partial [Clostridiales bacterium]|nr:V-type ATP synthase subunit A [Clostridiales bacterium]
LNLWFDKNVNEDWEKQRAAAMRILQEEASLDEIVRLVGMDALSQEDRLTMETAKSIREDYLHQNAFHEVDTFASLEKQYKMLRLILLSDELGRDALARRVDIEDILALPVREEIGRSKYIPESEMNKLDEIENKLKQSMAALISEGEI